MSAVPHPSGGATPELLPCPFCGEASAFVAGTFDDEHPVAVACDGCGAGGSACTIEEDAVAAWNRRAPVPGAETPSDEEAITSSVGWPTDNLLAFADGERQASDEDFPAAMRFMQLVVTMPEGREHTSVPCSDLRAVARYMMSQQARLADETNTKSAGLRPSVVPGTLPEVEHPFVDCDATGADDPLPYATRKCRGHWHVTVNGEDLIGEYASQEAAQAEADSMNEFASRSPETPQETTSDPVGDPERFAVAGRVALWQGEADARDFYYCPQCGSGRSEPRKDGCGVCRDGTQHVFIRANASFAHVLAAFGLGTPSRRRVGEDFHKENQK